MGYIKVKYKIAWVEKNGTYHESAHVDCSWSLLAGHGETDVD